MRSAPPILLLLTVNLLVPIVVFFPSPPLPSHRSDLARSLNTDEAVALGAVYQAAALSKGFRVKTFLIKDANVFPIEVRDTDQLLDGPRGVIILCLRHVADDLLVVILVNLLERVILSMLECSSCG